jgi:hypothetical protein
MAGALSRRLRALCTEQQIPLIEAQAGERNHELAEPHWPKDKNFSGLFLVITGTAQAPVWEVKRHAVGHIIEIRHRKRWPYVKHSSIRTGSCRSFAWLGRSRSVETG